MERDPQLLGPLNTPENSAAPSAPGAKLDLQQQNPGQDFFYLFRAPKVLFAYFSDPQRVNGWLLGKATLGFIFVSWLASFSASTRKLLLLHHLFGQFLDQSGLGRFAGMLGERVEPESLRHVARLLVFAANQFSMALAPLFSLLYVALAAAAATLLLPLMGVAREKLSFTALFTLSCYSGWYGVLQLFPFLPPWLVSAFVSVMNAYALKWAYGVSFWRGYVALHGAVLLLVFFISLAVVSLLAVFASPVLH